MCYLAHAPPVARVLAGLVEIMGRAVRAAEALRGLQRRLSMRSAHREAQVAQEAVRESGRLKLDGEQREHTLTAADNYALSLIQVGRFKEAKSILSKMFPVARRVLGASNDITIRMVRSYAKALYSDPAATLEDLREAVTTLEDADRTARRVLGGAHPLTAELGIALRRASRRVRDALRAREA